MAMFTWGVAFFGFWCLLYIAEARNVFVSAPNTLRLGAEETIAIVTDGIEAADAFVVYLQDFPARKNKFSTQNAVVRNGIPTITKVKATQEDLPEVDAAQKRNTYVYLVVTGTGFSKEFKLLVSPQSGYMFIQTDKPIYTPKQTVNIRLIPLNERLRPKHEKVRLQIRNPQDIVVEEIDFAQPWNSLLPGTLFPTHNYKFPPSPMLGEWSVIAQYGHKFQLNSTVLFKVDEYVLPTFTVTLKVPNVVLPENTQIQISAFANYVYGKKVEGTAMFKFGVKHKLGNIIEIGNSKVKTLEDGDATVIFRMEEITNNPKMKEFPAGDKLFVEVDVVDAASGNREKAINEECTFASSPYVISFKHSQKDFKPGLVSVILAEVTYINGKPASGIPTSISVVDSNNRPVEVTNPTSISKEDGSIVYNVNTPIGSPRFVVTIKTNDKKYKPNQQYTGTHTLSSFQSSGSYIAISRLEGSRLHKVNDIFSASVYALPAIKFQDVFYLVLSQGRIVHAGRLSKDRLLQRELQFVITAEMSPSFRIVAYALDGSTMVADSIRVEVEQTCKSQAEVKIKTKTKETTPGGEQSFLLKGEPQTSVGILAVDSAVYALRDKDRLTKDKLFKTLESSDLGCGPGGGINTEKVLANAGIVVFGSFPYPSKEKSVLGCAERVRRKREAVDAVVNELEYDVKKCCKLGFSPDRYGRSCEERAHIVQNYTNEEEDGNCTVTFLKCCNYLKSKDPKTIDDTVIIDHRGRFAGLDAEDLDLDFVENLDEEERQATVRKDFRETWLFQDAKIKESGTTEVRTSLPHSITTWIIQAVSISQLWGTCVSEPKELVAFKKIFLQVNLPYAVVQNEQLEVRATIFNYDTKRVPVTVYMYGVEDLCTGVQPGEKSERKRIHVNPHSAETIGFPIVPLKKKEYTIRIVALSMIGHDVIEKTLNVVAQGKLYEESIPVVLDPGNQRRRKERDVVTDTVTDSIDASQTLQVTTIKLRPSKDFIPGTESCVISAIGDEFGPTVETVLHGPETLVKLPIGCGEQTMMFMGPTVYTLHYMKVKGKLTPEFEGKVYGFVREGYNRELTFRKTDGSYAAFAGRQSSTWLTAFVMKIFCQSSKFIFIDKNVICTGLSWLLKEQNNDGSFTEKHRVIHWDMMGGIKGAIPMTAFVLISLQECSCDEIEALKLSKLRALLYIENALPNINDPYILSLVSYALALSNSELKNIANEKLRGLAIFNKALNQRHWSTGSRTYIIETTAYALLTQVALGDLQYSLPIINWLNTQRLAGGAFPSTQDTVVALQALSEYAMRSQSPSIDLQCNVTYSNDRKLSKVIKFDNNNADVLQEFELNKIGGTVFFRTVGTGVGLMSVKLRYNVPHAMDKLCKFDVTVDVGEAKAKIKPAIVKNNIGKDFFDEELNNLVEKDDLGEDRRDKDIKFDEKKLLEFNDGIDPRVKGEDNIPHPVPRVLDGDKNDDWDDDDDDDRDRAIREDNDDRDKAINGDEDDRGRIQKANSKRMFEIVVCARHLAEENTDMSIIDIGIFSGYKPVLEDLNKLIKDNIVDRYEMAGRGIIFYLNNIPREKPVCLNFRIAQEFIVGAVQPTVISVYDYYNPDTACTIFYSPDSNSPLLKTICQGAICQCAEGGCPDSKPFSHISIEANMARDQLLLEACENHNYVWRGIVKSMKKKDGFIRIRFTVTRVLKPGAEPEDEIVGFDRTLLLQDSCTSFELMSNHDYLIMGNDGERFEDRDTNELQYRYLMDKTTLVHEMVKIRELPNKESKALQKAVNWVEKQLVNGGCRN